MKNIIIFAFSLFLTACATPKVLQAIGGSRADGIIEMGYEVASFQRPVIDWGLTQNTARERCSVWGYSDAQPFGGEIYQCQAYDGHGTCIRALITIKYQCIGNP